MICPGFAHGICSRSKTPKVNFVPLTTLVKTQIENGDPTVDDIKSPDASLLVSEIPAVRGTEREASMSWRDKLEALMRKAAVHWVYTHIPHDRTTISFEDRPFDPGNSYVRLKLVQMFLGDERVWYQKRAPVVHALLRFLHQEGYYEMPVVLGPTRLEDMQNQQLQRVIALNQTILGPVPYLGGDFEVFLALFAAKTQDYARTFLDLLGSISEVVPVSGLSIARGVLGPLQKGLEGILGLGDIELRLGIRDTFSRPKGGGHIGNPLRCGYWVLIAKEEKDLRPEELWITERGVCRGVGGKPGELLAGCDYLVFLVERLEIRDWRELPFLNISWLRVEKAIETGDEAAIDRAFNLFKWTLLGTGDLIPTDRFKVLKEQIAIVRELVDAGGTYVKQLLPEIADGDISPEMHLITQGELAEAAKLDWKQ